MNKAVIAIALVAVLAGAGGYFAARQLAPGPQADPQHVTGSGPAIPTAEDLLGQPRPGFVHRDATGKTVLASQFDGNPLLLNFWATWCAPCVEEMPMLSALQREQGDRLQVVGIAVDDAQRASQFAAEMDLAYPVLLGDTDVVITSRRYGNRSGMLPFTVLVDSEGIVRWTHLGAVERADLLLQLDQVR